MNIEQFLFLLIVISFAVVIYNVFSLREECDLLKFKFNFLLAKLITEIETPELTDSPNKRSTEEQRIISEE